LAESRRSLQVRRKFAEVEKAAISEARFGEQPCSKQEDAGRSLRLNVVQSNAC